MTYDEIFSMLSRLAAAKKGALAGIPDTSAELHLTGSSSGVIGAVVKNGAAVITKGSVGSPDAAVTLSCNDFSALLTGKLNPMAAVLSGRIRVSGDYARLMHIIKLIKG